MRRLNKFKKRSKELKKIVSEEPIFNEEEGEMAVRIWFAMDKLEFNPEQIQALAIALVLKVGQGRSYEELYRFLEGFRIGLVKENTPD